MAVTQDMRNSSTRARKRLEVWTWLHRLAVVLFSAGKLCGGGTSLDLLSRFIAESNPINTNKPKALN